MKVVWTERAWARLTEIEAFVARDHPEAAARLVDKLIARGDALGRYPAGSGLRELVVDSYRIVYRRVPNTIEVLTVFEGHRLLRRDELPEDV